MSEQMKIPIILVTGMSGAGKSVALKALEDMGYDAVDNLPLGFVFPIINGAVDRARPLAIGTDVRSQGFSDQEATSIARLARDDARLDFKLLFLDCDDEILQRRYTETRRKHPLAPDRPLIDGIRRERETMMQVRQHADEVIDTSVLTSTELRYMLAEHYAPGKRQLSLMVTSFSYRHGIPREADLVFDVRFLRNPFYVPELKDFDGREVAVGNYVAADPDFIPFFDGLTGLILPLLPRYLQEGKSYLTIAIGCTGGKHRSVYTSEQLAKFLEQRGFTVGLRHRELQK